MPIEETFKKYSSENVSSLYTLGDEGCSLSEVRKSFILLY